MSSHVYLAGNTQAASRNFHVSFLQESQEGINSLDYRKAIENMLIELMDVKEDSNNEELFRIVLLLIPHFVEDEEKRFEIHFKTFMQRLPKLLKASSHLPEFQAKLAIKLAERHQMCAEKPSSEVKSSRLKEEILDQTLVNYRKAIDYYACAIKITEKQGDQNLAHKLHRTLSQLLLRIFRRLFGLQLQTFVDHLNNKKGRPIVFGERIESLISFKRFCCADEDKQWIKDLCEGVKPIFNQLNPNSEKDYLPYLSVLKECLQPFSLPRKTRTEIYREHLQKVRVRFGFAQHEQTREFQRKVLQDMRGFVSMFLEDIFIILGPPPCGYDIRAMGSLGREEPCPYSDLEFMILIEEEEHRSYFKQLAQLLEFQVISLGETAEIRPVFTCIDRTNASGFHFDVNPLSESCLLETPRKLAQQQISDASNVGPNTIANTLLKSVSLSNNCPSLFEEYQEALVAILDTSNYRHDRFLALMKRRYEDYQLWSDVSEKVDISAQSLTVDDNHSVTPSLRSINQNVREASHLSSSTSGRVNSDQSLALLSDGSSPSLERDLVPFLESPRPIEDNQISISQVLPPKDKDEIVSFIDEPSQSPVWKGNRETILLLLSQARAYLKRNQLESVQELAIQSLQKIYEEIANEIELILHDNISDEERLAELVGRVNLLSNDTLTSVGVTQKTRVHSDLCELYRQLRSLYKNALSSFNNKTDQPDATALTHAIPSSSPNAGLTKAINLPAPSLLLNNNNRIASAENEVSTISATLQERTASECLNAGSLTTSFLPQSIDIKIRFVQFLNFFLADMALNWDVQATNTLDIIDALGTKGVFTRNTCYILKKAASDIYRLRVRLHEFYGEQKEDAYLEGLSGCVLLKKEIDQLERIYWLILRPLFEGVIPLVCEKNRPVDEVFQGIDLIRIAFKEFLGKKRNARTVNSLVAGIASILLESGASFKEHRKYYIPLLSDELGSDLLWKTYLEAVKSDVQLVKRFLNIRDSQNNTVLHRMAKAGDFESLSFIISLSADLESRDDGGRTALHRAVMEGQLKVAQFLIRQGANVLAITNGNETVLHLAVSGGHLDELTYFKNSHPELLLRAHYLDTWGELSLPMAKETFPIRELYTHLRIVKKLPEQSNATMTNVENSEPLKETDSWMSLSSGIQYIELFNLFQPQQGQVPRKILLIGRAGIGKSTLCQKIAHDWASGRLWDQFESVYWIPLRLLNQKNWNFDDLHHCLSQVAFELILKDKANNDIVLDYIRKGMQKSLWVFDGFDEASPNVQALVIRLLQEKDLTIILTSRPEVVETVAPFIELSVENVGFSETHIQSYVEQFFGRKEIANDAASFLKMLKSQERLSDIAHIPLQLQMLCSLWEQKKERFSASLTGLYQQIVEHVLEWNNKKLDSSTSAELLQLLGKVAESGLMTGQLIISREMIESCLQGSCFTLNHLLHTGLLKESAEGDSFAFLHLSFQEYLAAHNAALLPLEHLQSFIQDHRGQTSFHSTLTFLCGLLYQSNKHLLPLFFNTLIGSSTFTSEQEKTYLVLTIQCINECPNYQEEIAIVDHIFVQYLPGLENLFGDGWIYTQTHALKYIFKKQPSLINKKDKKQGALPFYWICFIGNIELMQWLVSIDRSFLSKTWNEGGTALHAAAEGGHFELAKWLVSENPSLLRKFRFTDWTPLHAAVLTGHLNIAQWLYSLDSSFLHTIRKNRSTLLHTAAVGGHLDVVKWLVSEDSSLLSKAMKDGMTPLHTAVQGGHLEVAKWLFSMDNTTILLIGADQRWEHEVIDLLIENPKTMKDEFTLLHETFRRGHLEAAKWFISKTPSILSKSRKDGLTLLHLAAREGNLEAARWLVSIDPSLLSKSRNDGWSPLHMAVINGHFEITKWLVSEDSSLLSKAMKDGMTPLHAAVQEGHLEVAKWLVSKDLSLLSKSTKGGWTPLHLAARGGHLETVKWLALQDPKQTNARTTAGETPYNIAVRYKFANVASWLQEESSGIGKDKNRCVLC